MMPTTRMPSGAPSFTLQVENDNLEQREEEEEEEEEEKKLVAIGVASGALLCVLLIAAVGAAAAIVAVSLVTLRRKREIRKQRDSLAVELPETAFQVKLQVGVAIASDAAVVAAQIRSGEQQLEGAVVQLARNPSMVVIANPMTWRGGEGAGEGDGI